MIHDEENAWFLDNKSIRQFFHYKMWLDTYDFIDNLPIWRDTFDFIYKLPIKEV